MHPLAPLSPDSSPAAAAAVTAIFQDAHQHGGQDKGLTYAGAVTPAQAWQLASSGAAAGLAAGVPLPWVQG